MEEPEVKTNIFQKYMNQIHIHKKKKTPVAVTHPCKHLENSIRRKLEK